jgi:lipopolysaccharide/colanic/teichoic acid biosynthesis glycosyltransferase
LRLKNAIFPTRAKEAEFEMLSEALFMRFLRLERKRTERSGRPFVLMLLNPGNLLRQANTNVSTRLLSAISVSSRETDLKGWYKEGSIIGVIFTEAAGADRQSIIEAISSKLVASLHCSLSTHETNQISITFHVFPEDWTAEGPGGPATSTLQTDLTHLSNQRKASLALKRFIDIAGSITGIILLLPFMVCIAIAIKLTSRGPVLFSQVRFGQYGRRFTFLKFRSMYVDNDHAVHRQYVERFITGASDAEQSAGNGQKLYKLTSDPRITRIGRFLRVTSLDELPQLVNVLLGDMSLVGPRPPVTYEVARYELWHRGRLLGVKPGITGLWQVEGRSRVTFDEMVRLDIRYARSWSLWLDIKILLQTPRAVLSGIGAC